nr:MAG TPA: hypothetical protein [Caudoviricetes sp.]
MGRGKRCIWTSRCNSSMTERWSIYLLSRSRWTPGSIFCSKHKSLLT